MTMTTTTSTGLHVGDRVYAHPNHRNCGQHIDCGPGTLADLFTNAGALLGHVRLDATGELVLVDTTTKNGGDPPDRIGACVREVQS